MKDKEKEETYINKMKTLEKHQGQYLLRTTTCGVPCPLQWPGVTVPAAGNTAPVQALLPPAALQKQTPCAHLSRATFFG